MKESQIHEQFMNTDLNINNWGVEDQPKPNYYLKLILLSIIRVWMTSQMLDNFFKITK
jgi:hypothetical protein